MAVLPVREKTIGVIAIVEMCEKCSHFRLMLAVEEMKIARPETREKYFVYYKENFERPPRGNTLKLTRVVWKSTQTSIICCCLFKRRTLFTCSRTVLKKERFDNSSSCRPAPFINIVVYVQGHADVCQIFSSFRRPLFLSPLKSSLAVSGLICRQVFGYLKDFDQTIKKIFYTF